MKRIEYKPAPALTRATIKWFYANPRRPVVPVGCVEIDAEKCRG